MGKRIRISPGQPVGLKLIAEERSLVLDESLCLDQEIETKLRQAKDDQIMLNLDELDLFAGEIAAIANHANDRKIQRKLDRIFERIEHLLETFEEE